MSDVINHKDDMPTGVEALFGALKNKNKLLTRIFIANNGLSAVKFIKSMVDFSYQGCGKNVFEFYGMATMEDLEGGYEYCTRLTDFEIVDSGPSETNFGNVELVVRIAVQLRCECLWAGWGHASENPELPAALEKAGIIFLGPSHQSMWLLGNKISCVIMAEKLGISLLPYYIDDRVREIHLEVCNSIFTYDFDITSVEKHVQKSMQLSVLKNKCRTLKFPVMLKMSHTGGGRGIRKIKTKNELDGAIDDCSSGLFLVVECVDNVRHIEVQVVSDNCNNVLTLGERDCTTQRRHQKVIETAVSGISCSIIQNMERDAERLVKEARYTGLATVEFLYDAKSRRYYLLEVNTRIQVEHTVTEMLFGVNLPAIQYMIGMGTSVPDIRDVFEISTPKKYVMGVRITAENPACGFDPVTGRVSVRYEPSPEETGYFSVYNGTIHEYSESQFGHVFVCADTRRMCIAKCLRTLSSIEVEYIETPIRLISMFIQTPEFMCNNISTSSLETFARNVSWVLCNSGVTAFRNTHACQIHGVSSIKKHQDTATEGGGAVDMARINFVHTSVDTSDCKKAEAPVNAPLSTSESFSREDLDMIPCLVVAAVIAVGSIDCIHQKRQARISFLLENVIYTFEAHLASPSHIVLETKLGVSCIFFIRISASKIILKQRTTHIVKFLRAETAYSVVYNRQTYFACTKFNSNGVLSPKSGKLVSICKRNGDCVLMNDVIFEIESMKIRSVVLAPFGGIVSFVKKVGDRVASQELVCTIENASDTFRVFDGIQEMYVDDGTLTLRLLEGFSVPSRIWHVPERPEDIDAFIDAFLRDGVCVGLCHRVLEALKGLLAKNSVGLTLRNRLVRNLRRLVLRCDDGLPSLYSCIEFCVDALEDSVQDKLLSLRPYLEDSFTESPIRIHYMRKSAFRMGMDAKTSRFLTEKSLFIHFIEDGMSVETHVSVYLSEDFWPTLLSNIKMMVLRDRVASDNCSTSVQRKCSRLVINIYGDSGTTFDELPSSVFGHLNSCKIENTVLYYQDHAMQYEMCTIRGFLETKLVKNDVLLWYRLNLRPMRGVRMQDVMFDKSAFVSERILARKNNTVYYRDFMDIVKIYFASMGTECKVSEIYMYDSCSANEFFAKGGASTIRESSKYRRADSNTEDTSEYPWYVHEGRKYTLSQHLGSFAAIGVKGFVLEYNKRKVVMIFNDISHKHGSFSILEDIFFYLLTKYCRVNKYPRVFVASNSGARVGICDEIVNNVEAVAKDGKIEYLVIKENVNFSKNTEHICTEKVQNVLGNPAEHELENMLVETVGKRKKILSIFGNTDSGPENLSFSALIAAETSRAYKETLTVSYVTGMCVGIGAYLVRLGERIIQKQGAPILLTGYKVLNRLLQEDIYKSNIELGGFDVLGYNGVSHLEAYDELHGVEEIFWWVEFYFSSRTMQNRSVQSVLAADPEDMHIEQRPDTFNDSFNEREVLEKVLDDGTFKEYQRHWAPNVIVGRGYIGSTAIGIICPEVETRVVRVPCEPYETSRSVTWTKNVMFCETAEKIARAIEDFNNEKVDLLIVANWKGFSGSTTSMFEGIMKTGADIIKNLTDFRQKIIVYLPPHGELRGGTYVVFDKKINQNIHIIAHPTAGVGIIQPDGLREIKMRNVEDRAFAEVFCMLHDNVYRMVRHGIIDGLVKTQGLRKYITSYLGL